MSKRQYEIRARNFCDTLTFTVKPNLIKCDTAMEAITTPHANGGGGSRPKFWGPYNDQVLRDDTFREWVHL